MADNAIGLIETKGYVAALAAGDAMVKAANVTIVGREQVGDGLVSVTIVGDVGAVRRRPRPAPRPRRPSASSSRCT
jgi:ethanolamine utilization protein EutM